MPGGGLEPGGRYLPCPRTALRTDLRMLLPGHRRWNEAVSGLPGLREALLSRRGVEMENESLIGSHAMARSNGPRDWPSGSCRDESARTSCIPVTVPGSIIRLQATTPVHHGSPCIVDRNPSEDSQ